MVDVKPKVLIVMGVSGSGKSTVAHMLNDIINNGTDMNAEYIDGDDLHPLSNKDKMSKGLSLNDDDRLPW
eukprot:CAMPEP_0114682712 /NCGR_PEP_ID=MMETSP0191-20121206/56935_1 /TAXON_ID=126664 /ORGANISM="Sorites sp." /LENGTH=69 /DNA_ID=CAMNT_0001962835 /DNA_START=20 /DNA_END=226 /DNA_ORIENTATION=-